MRALRLACAGIALLLSLAAGSAYAAFTIGDATCNTSNKTAGTALTCTVAGATGFTVGNLAVMIFGSDELGGTTTDHATQNVITGIVNSGTDNLWSINCYTNAQANAAANGAHVCVAWSKITTAMAAGATITVNHASVTARAMRVLEFNVTGDVAVANGPLVLARDALSPGSIATSPVLTSDQYLFFRATALERANGGTWTPTLSFTSTGCSGTTGGTDTNIDACGEYAILTSTGQTSNPGGTNVDNASIFLAFVEGRTILGDGTDPASTTVAPGSLITDLDAFTLRSSITTSTVTALTVTLAGHASAFEALGEVRITNDAGSTTYFSPSVTPGSNTLVFSGGTAMPSITTTATQFKVRITPRAHNGSPGTPPASWPVATGQSYPITGTVTSITVGSPTTRPATGTDTDSATITVDNLSPNNVTGVTCAPATQSMGLSWTSPGGDYLGAVVLRRAGAAVVDFPAEGNTSYVAGSTIGSSTVVCAVVGTSCTDTTSFIPGTTYFYKVFGADTSINYANGGSTPASSCTSTLNNFQVVESTTGLGGSQLKTRVAGQAFAADILAANGNAILNDFTGSVDVELVNNTTGSDCATRTIVSTLSDEAFAAQGRKALTGSQTQANAYPNLSFRIKYPANTTPTITSCSDPFALRPAQFNNIRVRDLDRTTQGTTRTLNNIAFPLTNTLVHNAGRPFRIDADAVNFTGALTGGYAPSSTDRPLTLASQCLTASVCPGPATPGTVSNTAAGYSASGGTVTYTTASYDNAGSITLTLRDDIFSQVDNLDTNPVSTTTDKRITGSVDVGRFVPDHFALSGVTFKPRSDIDPGCSGSTFTYMDEPMSFAFTLTARASDGTTHTTATAYTGALAQLPVVAVSNYNLGARSTSPATDLTTRLDTSGSATVTGGAWVSGVAAVTALPTMVRRAPPATADTPSGPYTGISFGIAPSDPAGVIMQAPYDLDVDAAGGADHTSFGVTHAVKYGRLRVLNALGSEKLPIPVPFEVQHWEKNGFIRNTDDSCTTLSDSNIRMDFTGLASCATYLGNASIEFNSGTGRFTGPSPLILAAPSAAGSVLITPQLSTATGNYCPAGGGSAGTAVTAAKRYLLGRWNDDAAKGGNPDSDANTSYDDNPTGRAVFGIYGSQPNQFIYLRENH